jgi:hypothetical protein
MLRPTVSRPVCLGIKHPPGAYDQIFTYFRTEYGVRLTVTFLIPWGSLSDRRRILSFVFAAGPCQCSLSRVLIPWVLRPYFTVSDLRLLFVDSYDSQAHCGGIRPRLHTGFSTLSTELLKSKSKSKSHCD